MVIEFNDTEIEVIRRILELKGYNTLIQSFPNIEYDNDGVLEIVGYRQFTFASKLPFPGSLPVYENISGCYLGEWEEHTIERAIVREFIELLKSKR